MKLHLGVIDLPYSKPPARHRRHKAAPQAGTETTGDVATILEAEYHVMEIVFELHKAQLEADMVEALKGTVEAVMMGAPPPSAPFLGAMSKFEQTFKNALSMEELNGFSATSFDGRYAGIPTKAATQGISHRFKDFNNTKGKRGSRPSFLDTGLYSASFKAWIE